MTAAPLAAACSRPLAALRATSLENQFHAWRGRSGRRYICSVHPLDGAPVFDCGRAVVAAVREAPAGTEIACVFQPDDGEFAPWAQRARRCGASALHVHLLAETPEARADAAADLRPAPLAI
ncbi:hypothetical protein SAMN06265338_102417 [Rhodoblastus acidophilus]|uniref:Uncharacterized protein n=1 Tax=Rhodoblastus acidophilus TaxID=1074 RepID=A0A212R2M2_RHOAC|nr:hypothetical protein [Rhodoblastus acidophilus]MCW2314691.1 hypothetical protein [Rhodoblastus acidophilus]PPQ40301.1 hypothetical protein CKO16_00635 [Rhodoblastus acidophilus]RAI17398.1 hypothetical protein CH337_16660 [Rhodoblastus acidophilus]SNB66259.1 hypothetical protein SAMN06265338_102417 [Rhodoblastus acidophilus]